MAEQNEEQQNLPQPSDPPLPFDPSRMVGIIKRKALIKDLAAAYHAECLQYCQELLELQTKWDEDGFFATYMVTICATKCFLVAVGVPVNIRADT
ncbi:hypothetical protein KIW84_011269 [Lathyrus oleraceus]|uniref:Uncharacterized protein n=1 Tax=Pisum sativum TaxID=3888 RepID=A0A9D4YN03_PEA|nr:hypothetical protein KIW84_011269 [Pisum sativum]